MLSRQKQLIEAFNLLMTTQPLQSDKNRLYQTIISLRPHTSKDFDNIGFNLLHWATLCGQPVKEVERLIKEEGIDVNCGTEFTDEIATFNTTPLHFAVDTGNEDLAKCLLDNGANADIKEKSCYELMSPIAELHHPVVTDLDENISKFALRKGNATFKLFEMKLLEQYRNNRASNPDEYKSVLPACVASLFYHSKEAKLNAEMAYESLIKQGNVDDAGKVSLKNLKNTHPAVNQGELGELYQASLRSRKL